MKIIKNFTLLIILACLFTSTLTAQTLSIEYQTVKYDKIDYPAISLKMTPSPDKVKEAFKDFMKDKHDIKMKGIGFLSNKDVLYAEEVTIAAISDKTIDFRTKVVEKNDETTMDVFASFGYDLSINRMDYPEEYRNMRNLVLEFVNQFLPNYYQERIDESQETLSDLNDDLENLRKDYKKNEKDIAQLQEDNEELMDEIEAKEKAISSTETTLKKRRSKLTDVKQALKRVD